MRVHHTRRRPAINATFNQPDRRGRAYGSIALKTLHKPARLVAKELLW
jgi:hypothetical protein